MGLRCCPTPPEWRGTALLCLCGCFVPVQVGCGTIWWAMWWGMAIPFSLWPADLGSVWIALSRWMEFKIPAMSLWVLCIIFPWIRVRVSFIKVILLSYDFHCHFSFNLWIFVVPGDPYPLETHISPAPTPAPSYSLNNFSGGYEELCFDISHSDNMYLLLAYF